MTPRVARRYINDLNRLLNAPSRELEALTKIWGQVQVRSEKRRRNLVRQIPKSDPIRSAVDLFGPIDRASDEVLFTQALAFLLDPARSHGFGKLVLEALLEQAMTIYPKGGAVRLLRIIRGSRARVSVQPEYRYRIEGERKRSVARSDLWIEASNRKKSGLVIVENKIDAAESFGQLKWYERKAEAWCKSANHTRYLLLFLTPRGAPATSTEDGKWLSISYLDVASALRRVWKACPKAVGTHWLAMFISSITSGVLEIDVRSGRGFTSEEIDVYLQRGRQCVDS